MKIKPLKNRVVVKRFKAEKTKGGILLPDSAQEKPQEGEVVSVGPGKTTEDGTSVPMLVKAGDRVLLPSYAGTEVKEDDEEYLIISEEEILGVLV